MALPFTQVDPPETEVVPTSVPLALSRRNRAGPMRILLVEDSEDNQRLIQAYLKKVFCTLEMAWNGLEALERIRATRYDLVLMDLQMPVMDGYSATRAIRAWEQEHARSPLPILALSAHARHSEMEKSLQAGCNAHLVKPIKKSTLLNALAPYLESGTLT
jgi:CheY-like chemotaxis protein